MSGTWDAPCAPIRCAGCGAENVTLFHIPGGWPGASPRDGMCMKCGKHNSLFREHFGDIKFISDGDAGKSGEAA